MSACAGSPVVADETLTWPVVGWRASQERVNHVAARLERGDPLDESRAPA